MIRALAGLGSAAVLLVAFSGTPVPAADLKVPGGVAYGPDCGPCGCLRVAYVRHPTIQTTYGTGFDPRNFDTQEPHYFLGKVRSFPRYYVDGVPVGGPHGPGSC